MQHLLKKITEVYNKNDLAVDDTRNNHLVGANAENLYEKLRNFEVCKEYTQLDVTFSTSVEVERKQEI